MSLTFIAGFLPFLATYVASVSHLGRICLSLGLLHLCQPPFRALHVIIIKLRSKF